MQLARFDKLDEISQIIFKLDFKFVYNLNMIVLSMPTNESSNNWRYKC